MAGGRAGLVPRWGRRLRVGPDVIARRAQGVDEWPDGWPLHRRMAHGLASEGETVLRYNDWISRWFEVDVARLTEHYATLCGSHTAALPTAWYFSHTA